MADEKVRWIVRGSKYHRFFENSSSASISSYDTLDAALRGARLCAEIGMQVIMTPHIKESVNG